MSVRGSPKGWMEAWADSLRGELEFRSWFPGYPFDAGEAEYQSWQAKEAKNAR